MLEKLLSLFQGITNWPIWQQFQLVEAKPSNTGSIFGFAEYLAALALFLVVMTASDFRFRYRLSLTRINLRRVGFWIGFGIGAAILAIDLWFQNGLAIPHILSNPNNLRAALAVVFLTFVFYVISVAVIRPPVFSKSNAKQFFYANYHFIHEGNVDRLAVIADELRRSLEKTVAVAATAQKANDEIDKGKVLSEHDYAANILLLIGDRRFCKVVVDKVPTFALNCFEEAQKYPRQRLSIFPFARNIAQEFIRNTNSSFYQEDSGFDSGLIGYAKPTTHIVFGSHEFIEKCAADGGSPLDTDYREFYEFNATQLEGFSRASLAFLESYLKATKGLYHSNALVRMLDSFKGSLSGVYQINGMENYHEMSAYERFSVTVDFIKGAIDLVDKHATRPSRHRISKTGHENIFDRLAQLIFKAIFAASTVSSPVWTAWSIQYNTVWSEIFGFSDSKTSKIIAFKVRRLLYEEIMRMDEFANFKGARILGYCLNVLGLRLIDRHNGLYKEFYPLQAAALSWTKANYKRLVADHPKVAEACLQGSVSYDSDKQRLVKTYTGDTGKEPPREYLDLS